MNDTGSLYQEYLKIQKIIKSTYDIDGYDDDVKKWLESRYKRIFNGYAKVYVSITDVRDICQGWIDKIVAENRIGRYPKGWIDLILFGLKGQYRKRKRFMSMFYTIYYDMASKLDALDGGTNAEVKANAPGFSI